MKIFQAAKKKKKMKRALQTGIAKDSKEQVLGPKGTSGITMGLPKKREVLVALRKQAWCRKGKLVLFSVLIMIL